VRPELNQALGAFGQLVRARRGHFRLESGHHSDLWLDLEALFADWHRVEPFVAVLSRALITTEVVAVCGPLTGGAFLAEHIARDMGVEFWHTERELPAEPHGMYGARYRLPAALVNRVGGKRCAMVDDVMSAGSALRATFAELQSYGATPVAAGALLVLGSAGADFFAQRRVPVLSVIRQDYNLWMPAVCPLCAAGRPVEDLAVPSMR
jgi:orotate phosphoribosyltransferase